MKSLAFLLTACLLVLPSCETGSGSYRPKEKRQPEPQLPAKLPDNAPAWLTSFPEVPGFPKAEYLLGIGGSPQGGDDTQEATSKARIFIANQIESDLVGVTETYAQEIAVNDDAEYTSVVTQKILEATKQLLAGARAEKSYRNPNTGEITVLVALNIKNHVAATLNKVRSELEGLGPEIGPQDESPGARLKRLGKEYSTLDQQMLRVGSLQAIVREGMPAYPDVQQAVAAVVPRYGRVSRAIAEMPVQVELVSGGSQAGFPDQGLPEPVTFRATVNGQALESVPVQFLLEYPEQAEISRASRTTDGQGQFSCRLIGLQLTGDAENEVWGRLDYASLGIDALEPPLGKTAFSLPTIKTARMALVVVEESIGQMSRESVVRGELESVVLGLDLRLIPIGEVLPEESEETVAKASSDWLKSKLQGKLDYILVGATRAVDKGTVNFAGTPTPTAHAGGQVRLVDLRSGDELIAITVQPNSKYSGVVRELSMAAEQAMKKFADVVAPQVEAELKAIFNL